ncbi:unnamed protein product, partial [Tetraodon nigroviridis]
DRDPAVFHHIFHFYKSGVLWIVREMCPIHLEEEIDYWGLSLKDTPFCCWTVFQEKVDEIKDNLKVDLELRAEVEVKYDNEGFKNMLFGNVRNSLWDIVENPYSSTLAKAFSVLSSLLVLFSIVAMALNTVKELQKYNIYGRTHMEWVEIITIVFFTFEYFIRLVTTPNIKMFLKSGLNFVDMVAVVPYFVQIVFEAVTGVKDLNQQEERRTMVRMSRVGHVLKVVKLMRIFRILKLARHSTGMRAFGFTLRQCYHQSSCILLFIAMGISTFSALLYSAERETEGSPISSIPDAWWWAAVTISTVGYGDVVPVSVLGRIVAFTCISFGIILNGMPISFLFNKFSDYYAKLKAQERPMMRNAKAKTVLLVVVALVLLVLHLFKDLRADKKSAHLRAGVSKGNRAITTVTRHKRLWPRCKRNTAVFNITGFGSLPENIKDFLYYRHCRHFPMLLDVPDKCGGAAKSAEVFLLLVVKSSPLNYDRREVLRKTWAAERLHKGVWIRRIFISGTRGEGHEKRRTNSLLELEQREYRDILQWDFSDSFYNLTLKQILFLEWMERNCPGARFLLNGDDDVFAHTDNMVEYLQSLRGNDGSQHLFTGYLIQGHGPVRWKESKYYIPAEIHKEDSYFPYCGGGGCSPYLPTQPRSYTTCPIPFPFIPLMMRTWGCVWPKPDSVLLHIQAFGLWD